MAEHDGDRQDPQQALRQAQDALAAAREQERRANAFLRWLRGTLARNHLTETVARLFEPDGA